MLPVESVRKFLYNDGHNSWAVEKINYIRIPDGYYECGFCARIGAIGTYGSENQGRMVWNGRICPICGGHKYIPDFKIRCQHCNDVHFASEDEKIRYEHKAIGRPIKTAKIIDGETLCLNERVYTRERGDSHYYQITCHKCIQNTCVLLEFEDLNKPILDQYFNGRLERAYWR